MKNNKGFTLIELLITIAIIAVLGVTVVFSITGLLRKSNINNYSNKLKDLFNAASTYSMLSASSGGINCTNSCNFTLNDLVTKGLVDKSIFNTNNPVYKTKTKFSPSDEFYVTKTNGVKKYSFKTGSCAAVIFDTIDDYKWEQC